MRSEFDAAEEVSVLRKPFFLLLNSAFICFTRIWILLLRIRGRSIFSICMLEGFPCIMHIWHMRWGRRRERWNVIGLRGR